MATLVSAATITTVVGTEVSALGLNPGASPGSYVYKLDVNALAAGEVLFIREYNIISLTAANLLSAAASSFEDGTTGGWGSPANCTATNTAVQGLDGTHALSLSSTAGGSMTLNSPSAINTAAGATPVAPGATYAAVAFFKTAVSARSCQVEITWLNSSGKIISFVGGGGITDATGGWTPATCVATAPTGAAYAWVQVVVFATGGAAEVHFVDCVEFGPLFGANLLTANQSSLETNTTGWNARTNCSISQVGTQAQDGSNSLQMSSTASGDMTADTNTQPNLVSPVQAGQQYTAVASLWASASSRSVLVSIAWLNAAFGLISTSAGTTGTDNTGGWTQVTCTGTAPANAVFAYVVITVQATGGAAELHFVDEIQLAAGTSTAWIIGGSQPGGWSIGGVERLNYFGSYVAGSDADPLVETVPILVDVNSRLTLHQKNGSARAIPVKVLKL